MLIKIPHDIMGGKLLDLECFDIQSLQAELKIQQLREPQMCLGTEGVARAK